MTDKEKIIKGLLCIKGDCIQCATCKYADANGWGRGDRCKKQCAGDAIALLKEQDNCENCAIAIEDRQPVVRCKDCKYWRQLYGDRPFYSSIGCCDCDDMWRSLDGETTEVSGIQTDSDFYCGYAVRR